MQKTQKAQARDWAVASPHNSSQRLNPHRVLLIHLQADNGIVINDAERTVERMSVPVLIVVFRIRDQVLDEVFEGWSYLTPTEKG